MRKELHKTVIICIWGGLLTLPGIAMLLGIGDIYTINENRVRAEMPQVSIAQAFRDNGEYCKAVETTFNDNFGIRDLLIRCKNQINYSIFRYSPELYFGKDGYFSYYNVVANEQVGNERMSEEQLKSIVVESENIKKKLQDQGIELKILIPAQKNTVFPERAEKFPVKRPSPNAYVRLAEMYKNSTFASNFVDVVPILRKSEETAPTFYRTDFHWNDWGAASAFFEAINQIARERGIEATDTAVELKEFELQNLGQAMSMPSIVPIRESSVTVAKKKPITSHFVDTEVPFELHWVNDEKAPLNGVAVFIGDSYTPPATHEFNGTNSGICDYFDELYFVHWDNSKGILNNLPEGTKYVFIESIESSMPRLETIFRELHAE